MLGSDQGLQVTTPGGKLRYLRLDFLEVQRSSKIAVYLKLVELWVSKHMLWQNAAFMGLFWGRFFVIQRAVFQL